MRRASLVNTGIMAMSLVAGGGHVLHAGQPETLEDHFLTTNVLAAVAGYHNMRVLPDGARVPDFSAAPEAGGGDEKGVLFYVVAPKTHSGKYFWMHHDGELASGKSNDLYPPDTLFSFPFGARRDGEAVISESDLFSIPSKGSGLCTLRPSGRIFFASEERLGHKIDELERDQAALSKELQKLDATLQESDAGSRKHQRAQGRKRYVQAQMEDIARFRERLMERHAEIARNKEILNGVLQEKKADERDME